MQAYGYDPPALNPNPILSLGFHLDADEEVWHDCAVHALFRLYWRVVYRHMTRLLAEHKPFWPPAVETDLCRSLMECILNYQSQQRTFYLTRLDTARTEMLPRKAAAQVASLGSLNTLTGELVVNSTLRAILVEYQVRRDFSAA